MSEKEDYLEFTKRALEKYRPQDISYFLGHEERFLLGLEFLNKNTAKENLKVWDLGTGFPFQSLWFHKKFHWNLLWSDLHPENKLEIDEEAKFSLFNICLEEFPKEEFDVIISTEVLEHLPCNLLKVKKKIKAALKQEGLWLVSFPLKGFNAQDYDKDLSLPFEEYSEAHLREFTEKSALQFLEDSSLEILEKDKVFCPAYGGVILVALLRKGKKKTQEKRINEERESQEKPRVLICITAKNDAKFLPRFLEQMKDLNYPKEKLKWIWMYGKSIDDTLDLILDFHKKTPYQFEVYEEPVFENKTRSSLWIADLLNFFKKLWKDEDYILFPDCDIVKIPPETLNVLIGAKKDIVAPYIWIEGSKPRQFFDTYIFRVNNKTYANVEIDGKKYDAWNPPFKDSKEPVQLQSVGSFILIKSKVFNKVSWDNPAPHYQFCKAARNSGFTVWSLPFLEIEHANVTGVETPHLPVEYYVVRGLLESRYLKKMQEEG